MSGSAKSEPFETKPFLWLTWAIFIGFAAILLHALPYGPPTAQNPKFLTALASGLATAAASLLIGGLLGFVFGIPRSLQQSAAAPAEPKPGSAEQRPGYAANTNLEQISDWLTKILVGVGLTQLGEIRSMLGALGSYLGAELGSPVLAVALVLLYLICGFLLVYLWTRLHMAPALRASDAIAMGEIRDEIDSIKQEQASHASTIALIQKQLDQSLESSEVEQSELNEMLRKASRATKVTVFYMAEAIRTKNWRDSKPIMERTIRVFRALIDSNPSEFHRNYGQLGYALKDMQRPDYKAALESFTTAITIRGEPEDNRFRLYEFGRAICRIMVDPGFTAKGKSDDPARTAILADLRKATTSKRVKGIIEHDATVARWLQLNELTMKALETEGTTAPTT